MTVDAIPFLRPNLVPVDAYASLLRDMDASRVYSNFGPLNTRFERRVVDEHYAGIGHVSTVHNCTLGLMLAIDALKREGGRYALMPSFTFAATALAAEWCGLEPYFIDIDETNWSMGAGPLEDALERLEDDVAVVIPYATFADNIDLAFYRGLVRSGVPVVVDAAPSFGASLGGESFGTGFEGAVVFSFHATKGFGIGEGGMVYSGNAAVIDRVRRSSNFGFSKPGRSECLGLNAKLPEVSAAIALATLDRFPQKLKRRGELYRHYVERFSDLGLTERGWALQQTRGTIPHQFFSALAPREPGPAAVAEALRHEGIESRFYFSPHCHQQEQFRRYPADRLSITDSVSRRVISLPLWEEMSEAHIERIVRSLDRLTP